MQLPYEAMLEIWMRASGCNEEAFWQMSLGEYLRWLKPRWPQSEAMSKRRLFELMEDYPDV